MIVHVNCHIHLRLLDVLGLQLSCQPIFIPMENIQRIFIDLTV